MRLSTRLVLLLTYYYSQMMGIISYNYNYRTGRVHTTRCLTIYCIVVNLLLIAGVTLIFITSLNEGQQEKALSILEVVYIVMNLVRIVAIIITLLFNWVLRSEFMTVVRSFRRWRKRYSWPTPIEGRFENLIVKKFSGSFISDVSLFILLLDSSRYELTWQLFLSILGILVFTNMLNVVMNHYYFAVLHVNLHFQILNDEMGEILNRARQVDKQRRRWHNRRQGAFINECCRLADQLDALAVAHHRLHKFADRTNNMYQAQGLCVVVNTYLNNISTFFIFYTFFKPVSNYFGMSWVGIVSVCINTIAYYYDLYLFTSIIIELVDVANAGAQILKRRLPLSLMDVRLEKSFECFFLQVVRNPMAMNLCGFLNFNKSILIAMLASTIGHTLFLMQLDYEIS